MEKPSTDDLIEMARQLLPLPSKWKFDYYCVQIVIHSPINFASVMPPATGLAEFYHVQFCKEFFRGMCIGWKFDSLK